MLDVLRSLPEPVLGGTDEKGNRKLCRRARRRGGRASYRGRSREHVYALIARDRDGRTLSRMLDGVTKDSIIGVLEDRIRQGSNSVATGLALPMALGLEQVPVNLSRGIRVIKYL